MANIDYSYEIVLVDQASKCMVVNYTAEGFAPMQIGVRLPYEGEDVEAVIRKYAPVNLWGVNNAPVVVPVAGVKGTFNASAQPEPQPIPVQQQITRAQGKAALIMQGHWQAVLDYVASIQDPIQRALAEVAINDTLTWDRSSPFLNAATAGLGMTDEQLDALFIQASGIAL